MPGLSKERRGEIAEILLRRVIQKEGIHLRNSNDMKRKLGSWAKETGLKEDEIMEFLKIILCEEMNRIFAPLKLKMKWVEN